ncbi:hypothetical protein HPP92_027841 [Vanilla planifolia]|uniref:Uncharacterized protein n=1 Tax=Vanilla planifolia TaxID=51239 RepID=A0A835PDF5_VANPL|nr:hypothetical protein HPP92_027841 [Vanilla planifolia]
MEAEAAAADAALAKVNIKWESLDCCTPIAVVKTRMQVAGGGVSNMNGSLVCQRLMVQGLSGTTHYKGAVDAVCKILTVEGFRGLYRGFGLTVVTQSPASALWWAVYGGAQHTIWRVLGFGNGIEKKPSQIQLVTVQATAGTIAGACSSIMTTPLDTIKTRLQVMDNYGSGRPSVLRTTRLLLEEDGWRPLPRFWTTVPEHVFVGHINDSNVRADK